MECPFTYLFGDDVECVYMKKMYECEDIDICTKNGDAWCVEHISIKEEDDDVCRCNAIEIIRTHEGEICAGCCKKKKP